MIKNKNADIESTNLAEDTKDNEYTSVDDMEIDVQEIELALRKLFDASVKESLGEPDSLPIFVLKLESESEFFFSVSRKTFIQVKNGTEVFPLFEDKKREKTVPGFFIINNEIFNIDPKKVFCLGWN